MLKYIRNESGQSMVLVALMLVVLLGFGALAIDVGAMTYQKGLIQNAADAAALAAAKNLPNKTAAISTAITYAGNNGIKATVNEVEQMGDKITVKTPYIDPVTNLEDKTKVEVTITRTFDNYLAPVLSSAFVDSTVTVRAVAQGITVWTGQALPFLNMESFGTYEQMDLWKKLFDGGDGLPGYFESLDKNEIEYINGSFVVKFPDGIQVDPGFMANGPHKIKDRLGEMWDIYKELPLEDRKIYCFSLAPKVFERNPLYVLVEGPKEENIKFLEGTKDKLQNGDNILLSELVLLECRWVDFDMKNKNEGKVILDFSDGIMYDLGNDLKDEHGNDIPDVPTGKFGMSQVGSIKLVE